MKNLVGSKAQVIVCRWHGHEDRFFAKFKDPATATWRKIPGGAFPPHIDTRQKAHTCAVAWFEAEMAERRVGASTGSLKSWVDVCDAFQVEVRARRRGADATRDEALKRSAFLSRSVLLGTRPIAEHDEALGLIWLRTILAEPLQRKGREPEPRDPLTVRNIARVLGDIYRFAQGRGWFPKGMLRPTDFDEFKAEMRDALKEKAELGKGGRTACPTETVRALVHSGKVGELRRVMTRTAFFTGLGPGEMHGLQVADYRREAGVLVLDIRRQQTLSRSEEFPSRRARLKTVHRRRWQPVHSSLQPWLDAWVATGWERHVGRAPRLEDPLFPDPAGSPFRESSCKDFRQDIETAGGNPQHRGHQLDVYSLRHSFATICRKAGIPSDERSRLLGHRPKEVKGEFYEDEDLPLLAAEIEKIPPLLDADEEPKATPSQLPDGASTNFPLVVPAVVPTTLQAAGGATASAMITAEEKGFEPSDDLRHRRFSKS